LSNRSSSLLLLLLLLLQLKPGYMQTVRTHSLLSQLLTGLMQQLRSPPCHINTLLKLSDFEQQLYGTPCFRMLQMYRLVSVQAHVCVLLSSSLSRPFPISAAAAMCTMLPDAAPVSAGDWSRDRSQCNSKSQCVLFNAASRASVMAAVIDCHSSSKAGNLQQYIFASLGRDVDEWPTVQLVV
jgi:hypothetical protein